MKVHGAHLATGAHGPLAVVRKEGVNVPGGEGMGAEVRKGIERVDLADGGGALRTLATNDTLSHDSHSCIHLSYCH